MAQEVHYADGAPKGADETEGGTPEAGASFYGFETRTLEGESVSLADWEGQVALVVNVASRCGLTPQYTELEAMHERLADRGFTVLGFPSNDFGKQEPGTAEEIREFCSATYGVTFPMFEKRPVTGDGR
ncbi:MAG: glutathione peroxidase, partial [Gemmatimonadetes bacterium]|nr:glutathione peroxidase [Gemmatimonadota bacterium]